MFKVYKYQSYKRVPIYVYSALKYEVKMQVDTIVIQKK